MSRVHSAASQLHTHRAAGPAVLDLIERLEKAEAGSRELDVAICCALHDGPEWAKEPYFPLRGGIGLYSNGKGGPGLTAPTYTTCLDAALALAEWVGLDGWNSLYAAMMSWKAHDPRGPVSRTLPLALCIAVLRATTPAEADAVGMEAEGRNAPLQSQPTPEGREERS